MLFPVYLGIRSVLREHIRETPTHADYLQNPDYSYLEVNTASSFFFSCFRLIQFRPVAKN